MIATAIVGATGCVSTMSHDAFLADTLTPRASFDLGCPKGKLAYTNLGMELDYGFDSRHLPVRVEGMTDQQGVSCGDKRAAYVYDREHGWVMNTDAKEGGGK